MTKKSKDAPPLPDGEFDVIVADPPWKYSGWKERGQGGMTYKTMSDEDICAMPVSSLAAPRSVLFLWGTWPKLPSALLVMSAWGFRYVTGGFVWIKTYDEGLVVHPRGKAVADESMAHITIRPVCGLGRYTKTSTEFVLMGVKGKEIKVADRRVNQVICAPRRKHSEKPDELYNRIERLYPDARKVELFARKTHPNWTSWGNEVRGQKRPRAAAPKAKKLILPSEMTSKDRALKLVLDAI